MEILNLSHLLTWIARLGLGIALFGVLTSAICLLLALLGAIRWRSHRTSSERIYLPPVSILKPVHGDEKELELNLHSFFELDYPDFELVFCARSLSDPAMVRASRLAEEFPSVQARFIACGEPTWTNPKIFSMEFLVREARHEIVLFSDSDVQVDPGYLRGLVQPMADPKVGLVTCIFRGKPAGGIWSLLSALTQTVEFSSGVLTANMLEGMKFGLGPALLTRKPTLQEVGGLESMRDLLADDFWLGNRVVDAGYTVVLSPMVVNHVVYYKSFAASLRHEIDWMKNTRRSRPAGHLGTGLTYAVPFGVLGLLAALALGHPALGLWLLFATCVNRWIQALLIGFLTMQDRVSLRFFWLYPINDLIGFSCWMASYCGSIISYRGEKYRIERGGRIVRAQGQ